MFAGWGLLMRGENDSLAPVFSPDHRYAARIAIGPFGEEAVEVFTAHGLVKNTVYYGELPNDALRWVSDTELTVSGAEPKAKCTSAGHIVVTCTPRQTSP